MVRFFLAAILSVILFSTAFAKPPVSRQASYQIRGALLGFLELNMSQESAARGYAAILRVPRPEAFHSLRAYCHRLSKVREVEMATGVSFPGLIRQCYASARRIAEHGLDTSQ